VALFLRIVGQGREVLGVQQFSVMSYAPPPTDTIDDRPSDEFRASSNGLAYSSATDSARDGDLDGVSTGPLVQRNVNDNTVPLFSSPSPSNAGPALLSASGSIVVIQVVAPATLPEGYELETEVISFTEQQRQTIKVKVPVGGVEQGQSFFAPMTVMGSLIPDVRTVETGAVLDHRIEIPTGHWRDGFFDLFKYGVCHGHVVMSFVCPLSECLSDSLAI
jgi:hypothetical protein